MSRVRRAIAVAGLAVVLGACGGPTDKTNEAPNDEPDSPASVGPPPVSASATTSAGQPSPGQTVELVEDVWPMPDLVGETLQDAQDDIQALTDNAIFITTSHDASGDGRAQLVDSNWKVCTQNVDPGAPITPETEIDFGAVKLDESCP